jgi:hypothetical protein
LALEAIELLREMNAGNARNLPDDDPVDFIRERWSKLIFTDAGVDRRHYELCALSELKNALRSGDIRVEGSLRFKNFNEYLVPLRSSPYSRKPTNFLWWSFPIASTISRPGSMNSMRNRSRSMS